MAKETMKVVGLMSGTSADGVDAALIEVSGEPRRPKVSLINFIKIAYPDRVRAEVLKASSPATSNVETICQLNYALGEIFAGAAIEVVRAAGLSLQEADLIGSHGQTVYHIPPGSGGSASRLRSTLQLGEPSLIAEATGITTVADFRHRDIAAGGLGAPLTPLAHHILFSDERSNKVAHNIGGISNITLLPKGCAAEDVTAFDTGPGNMVIDEAVRVLTKSAANFDENGEMAARGRANKDLVQKMLAHPFFSKAPPKSTGREEFGVAFATNFIDEIRKLGLSAEDAVATATEFTAKSMLLNYELFVAPKFEPDEVVLCGGGARNLTMRRALKEGLKGTEVRLSDDYGFPAEAVEAVAFALLAWLTMKGVPGNIRGATGASRRVVLGKIVPGV